MEEGLLKRVLPHNIEAEQSVLGSILMDNKTISSVSDFLVSEDFYSRQYGIIYETIVELYQEGKMIDFLVLADRLKKKDLPPEASELSVLAGLVDNVPTTVNIKEYANIVHEKSVMRKLIRVNEEIANLCYAGKEDFEEILAKAEKDIFAVVQNKSSSEFVPMERIARTVLENIERASRSKEPITGVPSGFIDLDYMTNGFQPSDFILIAARPSMGKTAFVLNVLQHVASRKKIDCVFFSLEMSKEQLVSRMISMQSGIDASLLRRGDLSDNQWMDLVEGTIEVGNFRITIDETPGISINELRSKCRKLKMEKDIKLVIIDYLQLMSGSGKKTDGRQQEISEISRNLKAIARELQAPVIALSQLSRACETRTDHRPMLSDLRESGAIEQDADLVMFLYRDGYYNKATDNPNEAEVIIAKQRNGPIGTVKLVWKPETTRFVNMAKD